jgi:hypothetical protein
MGGGVGFCCAKVSDTVPRLAKRTATNKFLCFIGYVGFELRTNSLKYSKILEIWNTANGFLVEIPLSFSTFPKIKLSYEKIDLRTLIGSFAQHAGHCPGGLLLPR